MTEIGNPDGAARRDRGAAPLATEHLDLIHREAEAGAIVDLLVSGEHDAALNLAAHLQENVRRELARAGVRTRRAWDDLGHRDPRVAAHALQATRYAISEAAGEAPCDRRAARAALAQADRAERLRAAPAAERAAARGWKVIDCTNSPPANVAGGPDAPTAA